MEIIIQKPIGILDCEKSQLNLLTSFLYHREFKARAFIYLFLFDNIVSEPTKVCLINTQEILQAFDVQIFEEFKKAFFNPNIEL